MQPRRRVSRAPFWNAFTISVVLHLLVVLWLLPELHDAWSLLTPASAAVPIASIPERERPLRFEFVDLADEREEVTDVADAPMSDLDRRAHGGEGDAPSQRPGSRGNTPQLVQSSGGDVFNRGTPSDVPQAREQQPPERPRPSPQDRPEPPQVRQQLPEPEGAGEPEQERPVLKLPQTGIWSMPPETGGLLENPNRAGGVVDSGGLSFDTRWYDWGPYAKAMLRKIRRNWDIPEIARFGVRGVVKIRFFIERDGTVTGLYIADESGRPPMDNAARNAILFSSRLPPLPSDLTGVEREGVTITFYYNTSPPE